MQNMSWNEALENYGIDFNVKKVPLFSLDVAGNNKLAPNVYGIQREDDHSLIDGVAVGKSYKVIQTSNYADIGERICNGMNAEFVNGGLTKDGKTAYLQAKLPDSIQAKGTDDVVDKYITFINGFGGNHAFRLLISGTRMFCQNQISFYKTQARQHGLSVRHTKNADLRLKQADKMVLAANNMFKTFQVKVDWLMDQKVTDFQMKLVARRMFGVEDDKPDADVATRTMNNISSIVNTFQNSADLKDCRGTGWAAHNAVSGWINHNRSLRQTTSRFESNLFGSGANLMAKGFSELDKVIAQAS